MGRHRSVSRSRNLAGVLAFAIVLGAPTHGEAREPSVVMAPGSVVDGTTQAEYAARWWQWARRVPPGVQPFQDPTGAQCGLNQQGDVWFLAGTAGTADIVRHCTMPTKTYVFLPIINMIGNAQPGSPMTCEQAKAFARANNDHLAGAEVSIDGKPVEDISRFRVASDCFDSFKFARYLSQADSYFPSATDGYWLMLRPLPAGLHRIRVRAHYDNPGHVLGDLEQVFEYQLQVQDPQPKPESVDPQVYI